MKHLIPENLEHTWEHDPYKLELYWTPIPDSRGNGQTNIGYKFYHDGVLIFEGQDYCTSPGQAIGSDASVSGILGFLSCGEYDVDPDFFKDYTPEQNDWRDEYAEELSCVICEMEEAQ